MTPPTEIASAIYCFAWAYDSMDADGCADCFTADGVFSVASNPEAPVTRQGRENLRIFFADAIGARRAQGQQPRHLISNLIVDEQSDSGAVARSYVMLALTRDDGTSNMELLGRYIDRLERVDGVWKIKERQLLLDRDLFGKRAQA